MREQDLEAAKRFHGHLGPYVMIGFRIGAAAMRQLDTNPHFDVEVLVECSGTPPESCIVDGLQVSTGATYGKRNIRIKEADRLRVTVTEQKSGRTRQYVLADRTMKTIITMPKGRHAVEPLAREMAQWPDEALFLSVNGQG